MNKIVAHLAAFDVNINGVRFAAAVEPQKFYEVLGEPSRVLSAGPPAPYGHRNNQEHIFDNLGICLVEHHARRTIDGIDFIFDSCQATCVPEQVFHGELIIAGHRFDPSLDLREYLEIAPLPFKRHLGTWYYYDGEKISITLTTFSRGKTKSGRPSKVRGISSISAGFLDRGQPKQVLTRSGDRPKSIEEEVAQLATDVIHFPPTRGFV